MKNIVIAHSYLFNKEVGEVSLLYSTDAGDLASAIERLEKIMTYTRGSSAMRMTE